jgi:O-antigen/teichoic acid export membrane protein
LLEVILEISKRITALRNSSPGYLSALTSGYLLMGANMLVQFVLTPFYLEHLGSYQFGVLMLLLNVINFAAIGITWMSGGLVRVIGEFWAREDLAGFRYAFAVGKYVFTLYALLVVALGIAAWWLLQGRTADNDLLLHFVLLAGLYLLLNYEALPERQAFVGTNRQATGNYIEFSRIILFALMTYLLLPALGDMSAVWIALMAGVAIQRLGTGVYWQKQVGSTGWKRYQPEMTPLLKRLAGRQGAGYVSYGALLLILQADTMIVGFLGGAEMAGQFVLLWKIPEAISLLLWKIPSAIEPRVIQLDATGEKEQMYSLFRQGRRWYLLLVGMVSLVYMLSGQWLAELWVGEHAPDQGWMYVAGGIALFFNTFSRWPVSFAYALIRLAALTRVAVIEVVGKLLLTALLFPYFNIASPIIASIATHIGYVAYGYQRIMRPGVHSL